VGVAEGTQGKAGVENGRSQAGIIVISDFVMKIKLHEILWKYQFMKINFSAMAARGRPAWRWPNFSER
jgi:hypothetical protein